MWGIIWTDPDLELVGEHRARKERERDEAERSKTRSGRGSMSTASSRSSTAESAFARFRSRGLRQANTSKAASKIKSSASSGAASSSVAATHSTTSPFSKASGTKSRPSSGHSSKDTSGRLGLARGRPETASATATAHQAYLELLQSDSTCCFPNSPSAHPLPALATPPGLCDSIAQFPARWAASPPPTEPLQPSPMARLPILDLPSPVRKAFIIPGLRIGEPMTPPQSPTRGHPFLFSEPPEPSPPLVPPPKSPLRARVSYRPPPPNATDNKVPRTSDHWRSVTPEIMPAKAEESGGVHTPAMGSVLNAPHEAIDLASLMSQAESMAKATPEVALSRLKTIWSIDGNVPNLAQLEAEKKRWMLSVVTHLDVEAAHDKKRQSPRRLAPDNIHNILALYESKASALYLAALNPKRRICHFSDSPLPHEAVPNVQPLSVAAVSSSAFPIPPQLFEAAYSLSLPAICTTSDLRGIVHNVSSALKPGGTLHLTLIDPLPCANTLGAKMRQWLEQHLLSNLRRESRCMSPSTALPQWLGEASLRATGSTLTTTKFYATLDNLRLQQQDPDPAIEQLRAEKKTKAELRSLVGRLLWKEIWGRYVTTDSWWWDDRGCMEECLQLGTFWEYHLIEAVKDATQ
ncbi:hypothetical protein JDV02_010171 [Purpureocillium takamizusanense]|uniref:Uncharacterized protein n=1 Tax=Purpureocillium takamizusanense TaxID=2060973 RepID=A0A9Q8QTY8_9HYPO|nr:uncharacterized protein JDV02_010171 [Purpureocillium takamizusanense]UNI24427.1 hypothetical protein JDV02_010171 [Purpureocillium takamizusanense]